MQRQSNLNSIQRKSNIFSSVIQWNTISKTKNNSRCFFFRSIFLITNLIMDHYLAILTMILFSIQNAYICDTLDDINLSWSIIIDQIEQIMEDYNNLDNFSEQANDLPASFHQRTDYINNVIINPWLFLLSLTVIKFFLVNTIDLRLKVDEWYFEACRTNWCKRVTAQNEQNSKSNFLNQHFRMSQHI